MNDKYYSSAEKADGYNLYIVYYNRRIQLREKSSAKIILSSIDVEDIDCYLEHNYGEN